MVSRTKGKNLIRNINSNFIDETFTIPTETEVIQHIMNMDDEEFDCHVSGKPYTVRKEIHDDYDKTMERLKSELKTAREEIERLKKKQK